MTAFTGIGLGTSPNAGDGEEARSAGQIINDNFALAANKTEDTSFAKFLGLGPRVVVAISSGTLIAANSNIAISGEGASADDLDNITGGNDGDLLILSALSDAITVTEIGNINLGAATRVLSSGSDRLMLHRGTTNWNEASYSDNA